MMLSLSANLMAAAGIGSVGGVSHCDWIVLICEETTHLLFAGPYAAYVILLPYWQKCHQKMQMCV